VIKKFINFILKIFGVKQDKDKKKEKDNDDIYPMW
jgi:hypothetical protein